MSYKSRAVKIGGFDHVKSLEAGGGSSVVIQTMWKSRLSFSDLEAERGDALKEQIEQLEKLGCGLLRFAVPDLEAAEVLGNLSSAVSMPLTADIHFDYKIALRCLDFPIAKIRINPGNIGSPEKQKAVIEKAAEKGRPIRIGVNAGSLPLDLREKLKSGAIDRASALVEAAERELPVFDQYGFRDVLVSMKASGIADTIKANRLFASRVDLPLHIGLTEAGPLVAGTVRNTAAILPLLEDGIGDTLRISLSDTVENEVIAAREILQSAFELGAKKGKDGLKIVSCPLCGRCSFDTHAFLARWMNRLYAMDKNITIAIMGCVVNGPGEAAGADLGITGAGNKVLIFRNGKAIKTIEAESADEAFEKELNSI